MDMRYEISNWKQLSSCQSNNSRKLHIHVSSLTNNDILQGTKIEVDHDDFGVLYACVVGARGNIVSPYDGDIVFEETTEQILQELAKYGFEIVFKPVKYLSKRQIEFLKTVRKLGYDKLRILNVWENKRAQKVFHPRIVVFNSNKNPRWLDVNNCASMKEFNRATLDGSAAVVPDSKDYKWDWLFNFVANIDDVLKDNAGVLE